MTSRDFAYWLQGFFEINSAKQGGYEITDEQIDVIRNHLNLVFKHEIDPSLNVGKTGEEIKELQDVHDGKLEKPTPAPKKDQNTVDWLRDKFKPGKLHGGWESGSSDNTLLRC